VKQAEQASPQQPHRQRSGRQMMNRQHRSTTNTIRTMIPTPMGPEDFALAAVVVVVATVVLHE